MTTANQTAPTTKQLELLAFWLKAEVRAAQATLDTFTKDFAANPVYTLSWSDGLARAAVTAEMGGCLLSEMEEKGTDFDVHTHLRKMARQMRSDAASPSNSSSAMSNLVSQAKLQVTATFVERFEDFVEYLS